MICVSAPGLPSYPRLMFDPKSHRAMVKVRHATWRSQERGLYAAKVLAFVASLVLLLKAWGFSGGWEPLHRLIWIGVVLAITVPPFVFIVRRTSQGFFARRIFPTTTTVWFTPEAIGFQSSLYEHPIAFQREWNGIPVACEFNVIADEAAVHRQTTVPNRKPHDQRHFGDAQVLRLVVSTNTNQMICTHDHVPGARAIPLTEVDAALAERLTMVYAAAANLTLYKPEEVYRSDLTQGHDIDRS